MQNYLETINSIFHFKSGKYTVNTSQKLCEAFGNPQLNFPTVHVAGTNGKGSVCTKIAKAAEFAGYRVGLYTSPHITCFRERMQINGEYISEEDIIELVHQVRTKAAELALEPSFFEIATITAFLYFQKQTVDLAVIEVGLGGRLDATNVLNPLVTAITSISLEHTQILGDTVEQIAAEKAGIVKTNSPVVIGPSVPKESVKQAQCVYSVEESSPNAVARQVLELLQEHLEIDEAAITKGLLCAPPCRLQKFRDGNVILDVAHNPASLEFLFNLLGKEKYRIIFGLSHTKDVAECLRIVDKHATHLHFVTAKNGRCFSTSELMKFAHFIDHTKISACDSTGIQKALSEADTHNEKVLVCGSFFILRDVLKELNAPMPFDPIDLNESR